MISKNDCLLLLKDISDQGIDTAKELNSLMGASEPPIEVIKFINDNRPLEVTQFYEKIRKSYNHKKSSLYKNIVTSDEQTPKDALTTLSSLLTQILLFSKPLEDKQLFLKQSRAKEISLVLTRYFTDYNIIPCYQLLRVVRSDIKLFESVKQ